MSSARKSARKSPNGDGCVRKRKDGRWEAIYSYGRDPATGALLRKSVYGKTQKEALEKLRQATYSIQTDTFVKPDNMTVHQWFDIWLEHYTASIKKTTEISYKRITHNYVKGRISGWVKLQDFTPMMAQALVKNLSSDLANSTAVEALRFIRRVFQKACVLELIRKNPFDQCAIPKKKAIDINTFNDWDEAQAFLDFTANTRYHNIFKLAIITGMRISEILGLPWKNIDFESRTINVSQQLIRYTGGLYEIAATKNGKSRKITVGKSALDTLQSARLMQKKEQLRAREAWKNEWGLVFTKATGEEYASAVLSNAVKRYLVAFGRPEMHFHDFRHTYAVLQLQAGIDIKTVQHNLGHSSAKLTLDVYAKSTEKMQYDAADKFENLMANIMG